MCDDDPTPDHSPHFSREEMECHCGCGLCFLDPRLLPALEELRALNVDQPITVDCAYRCPKHNVEVGGVSGSEHPLGMAADIRIPGKTMQEMYDLAEQVDDFRHGGIGVYDEGFIHVDTRETKARWARVKRAYMSIGASGLLKRW